MGENYDYLINAVESRWIDIKEDLKEATSTQVLRFILAELERNDRRLRILDRKATVLSERIGVLSEKGEVLEAKTKRTIDFLKKFGKDGREVTRNLKKILKVAKTRPTLPIKKEFRRRGERWVNQERK